MILIAEVALITVFVMAVGAPVAVISLIGIAMSIAMVSLVSVPVSVAITVSVVVALAFVVAMSVAVLATFALCDQMSGWESETRYCCCEEQSSIMEFFQEIFLSGRRLSTYARSFFLLYL